jgi:hypothetical protein
MEVRANRIKDISNNRYGSLLVVKLNGRVVFPCGSVKTTYECKCDCGNVITTKRSNLVNGYTKSCGCLAKKRLIERNYKHGLTETSEYKTWQNMIARCTNSNSKDFNHYGGRGITVCKDWLENFENFYFDMGKKPKGHTIDRINVNGNYEPSNCRWATMNTQAKNRRNSKIIEFQGVTKCLVDWAECLGINYSTLHSRIYRLNKPIHEAFVK